MPRICNGLIPKNQPATSATAMVPRPTPWTGRNRHLPLEPRTSSTLRALVLIVHVHGGSPRIFPRFPAAGRRSLLVQVLQSGASSAGSAVSAVDCGALSAASRVGLGLANLHAADDLRVVSERLLQRAVAFHDVVRDVESEGIGLLVVAMDGELAAGAVPEAAVIFHEIAHFSIGTRS